MPGPPPRWCSFPGCDLKHAGLGYCSGHYAQLKRGEEVRPLRRKREGCAFPGCTRPHLSRGYCSGHYTQMQKGTLRPLWEPRDTTARDEFGNKECISCREWLPESAFGPVGHTRDKLAVHCQLCRQVKRYGITRREFEELLAAQGGGCAICGGLSRDGKNLHIDHDHACCDGQRSCGKCIRGLLCSECNRGLGYFRDDIYRLAKAAIYLYTRSAA